VAFLASLDYVAESGGLYEARITVLDERDEHGETTAPAWPQAMERWADDRYAALAAELDV